MLDRQKIETILIRRFPGAPFGQIAAAANGIMGLDDEWEEIPGDIGRHEYSHSNSSCSGVCHLVRECAGADELRLFRRRIV
jgi:hypothetical protein